MKFLFLTLPMVFTLSSYGQLSVGGVWTLNGNWRCGPFAPDLFYDSWDTSTTPQQNWTSISDVDGVLSVSSTTFYGPSGKSLKCDNSAGSEIAFLGKTISAHTTNWFKFQINPSTIAMAGGAGTCQILTSSGFRLLLRTDGSGNWTQISAQYKNDSGVFQTVTATGLTPTAAAWNEIRFGVSSANIQVWVDAIQVLNFAPTSFTTFVSVSAVFFGQISAGFSNPSIIYFDNFEWREDSNFLY